MSTMSFVQLCGYIYPGQMEMGNIAFGMNPGETPFITHWSVPNIPQPTIDYLQSQIPIYQHQFDIDDFQSIAIDYFLSKYMDEIAAQRQYDSALSCISYSSSTNETWRLEAIAFATWRDSVFAYTIEQTQRMIDNQRSVPSFDEFKTELPQMVWP